MVKFGEAFARLEAGEPVGRGRWDEDTKLVLRGEVLCMVIHHSRNPNCFGTPFPLDGEDLTANDWTVDNAVAA